MNSPECWRCCQGLRPANRGYAATFGAWLNPIAGEYLEIPSTIKLQQGIDSGVILPEKHGWPFRALHS